MSNEPTPPPKVTVLRSQHQVETHSYQSKILKLIEAAHAYAEDPIDPVIDGLRLPAHPAVVQLLQAAAALKEAE